MTRPDLLSDPWFKPHENKYALFGLFPALPLSAGSVSRQCGLKPGSWVARIRTSMDGFTLTHLLAETKPPDSFQWVILGVMAAGTLYVAVVRPMLKKNKDPLKRSPSSAHLAQERSVERQMQNLLVELSEMARQISAQLDTRTAKLELLIREADEKIAALKSSGVTIAETRRVESASESGLMRSAVLDPRHAEIYALSDQGRAPAEIAQQLGQPSGEVELILALRQRQLS